MIEWPWGLQLPGSRLGGRLQPGELLMPRNAKSRMLGGIGFQDQASVLRLVTCYLLSTYIPNTACLEI